MWVFLPLWLTRVAVRQGCPTGQAQVNGGSYSIQECKFHLDWLKTNKDTFPFLPHNINEVISMGGPYMEVFGSSSLAS